ncbi:prolyl aminopeptidase [Oerskovia flava]|uniref:prolyl aminopeptidase n=1 Tax=Oerskovia flava TaxID=2986422 RepID=UPI00223FE3B3|nr:prolyl aminopeptidase [Oerskovia sp. JB1-3-2]
MYPVSPPHAAGLLEVGDGHEVYWETRGAPAGVPAVVLHGGPGSGCTPGSARLFDPERYRVVLLDQRGCGRSRPLANEPDADLSTNTTAHLVADLERLREHLGIDRWVVLGVSWGTTLALAYARSHPARTSGLVLGAVTTTTRREVEWITRDMGRLFPEEWDRFVAELPPAERGGDLAGAYHRLLMDPDPDVQERAARAWCRWEDVHVSLVTGFRPTPRYDDRAFRLLFARLVTHYWSHAAFLPDGALLAGASRLADVPGFLVHGRQDVSGPADVPWRLHRAWPGSELVVLEDAGHGGQGFPEAMIAATDRLAGRCTPSS